MDKPVNGWLPHACGQTVEHLPCPYYGGKVDMSVPAQGVMHTIEGSLAGGLSVFDQHWAPTFTVGGKRILQLIPLGYAAAALEHTGPPPTNEWARVQIEVQGFSKATPWDLASADPETFESLAHLLAALRFPQVAGIPLARPYPDAPMPAQPWADLGFPRRHDGRWGHTAGWYGHIEIPGNSHWDPGELAYTDLLARALEIFRAAATPATPRKLPSQHKLLAIKHHLIHLKPKPLPQMPPPVELRSEHGQGEARPT